MKGLYKSLVFVFVGLQCLSCSDNDDLNLIKKVEYLGETFLIDRAEVYDYGGDLFRNLDFHVFARGGNDELFHALFTVYSEGGEFSSGTFKLLGPHDSLQEDSYSLRFRNPFSEEDVVEYWNCSFGDLTIKDFGNHNYALSGSFKINDGEAIDGKSLDFNVTLNFVYSMDSY